MKEIKLVLVVLLGNISFFCSQPALAWYTYGRPGNWPIHESLAQLSLDKVHQTQVFGNISLSDKARALAYGAKAPDQNKKWMDHEATFRIRNTLCASLKSQDPRDAINRLARGFHYLADNGDATAGRYKEGLMKEGAIPLLFPDHPYASFTLSEPWRGIAFKAEQQVQHVRDINELVSMLRRMAEGQNKRLVAAYTRHDYAALRYEFMVTFAFIRASQNRLIDFYTAELSNGDFGECPAVKRFEPEKPRTVECSTMTKSGKDTPETIMVKVGWGTGTANFSYQMYTVKDRMIVNYAGQTLLDTGCISGSRKMPLYLNGMSDYVTVIVQPACEKKGTDWNFRLECPSR